MFSIEECLEKLNVRVIFKSGLVVDGVACDGYYHPESNSIVLGSGSYAVLGHECVHLIQGIFHGLNVCKLPCGLTHLEAGLAKAKELNYADSELPIEAEAFAWMSWYKADESAMTWLLYQLNKAAYAA